MSKCAAGGGEALNWSQNSGGWSRTSHPPSMPRGENTRSLARVASSSRRMPAIRPSKPCLASASFSPSVLRAAERAAGGKVGSTAEGVHLRKFFSGVDVHARERHPAEEGLARQPDHDVGIFAQRPQQRELLQPRKSLAQDVDALRLQRVEMVHRDAIVKNLRHGSCLRGFNEQAVRGAVELGFTGENRHLVDLGLKRRKFPLQSGL